MSPEVKVRSVARASDAERRSGMLAYLVVSIGPVIVDGVVLRRLGSGALGLSFPSRTKASGRRFSIVRPADDEARIAIESEVLRQLEERRLLGAEDQP